MLFICESQAIFEFLNIRIESKQGTADNLLAILCYFNFLNTNRRTSHIIAQVGILRERNLVY